MIESHGCAAGLKVGDPSHMSPQGVLLAERGPERVCLQVFPPLGAALACFSERIISGLDPYLFRRVGCLVAGVRCGGWGHVAFTLHAEPA